MARLCQFFCMDIFYNETKAMTDVDGLIERLLTHFDDCPPKAGERSFTRELLTEAAAALAELKAQLAEARGALPFIRKAGEILAPHSADPPGSPTRDALVMVNAALHKQAREHPGVIRARPERITP